MGNKPVLAAIAAALFLCGSALANAQDGPFQPNWDSLSHYKIPKWYQDAKFGIFIHWGVYSVPSYGSEWYPRNMYQPGSNEFKHHVATYGPQTQFGYKDFIPQFKAEKFDPNRWAKLFKDAGARYVVPVAEHHDGFQMYDSTLSKWNAKQMGPKRDIIGELSEAVRKQGMVFGLSSHRAEHWFFLNGGRNFPSDVRDPRYADFYGPAAPEKTQPDSAYLDDWLARSKELIDKYHPQVFWFDWWIEQPVFQPYLQQFAAYYYNRADEWGKGVAINYKLGSFPESTAVLDIERGRLGAIRRYFWQTDTSVSNKSWGYIKGDDFKPADELVDELVDIVSKNGCLLLNIGPRPDGTIPEEAQAILLQMGGWLKQNGEAVYGTRPWKVYGEGPTQIKTGSFGEGGQKFTGQDIRFTTKGGTLYATCLDWPGERVTIHSLGRKSGLADGAVRSVSLLGSNEKLQWSQNDDGLAVSLPAHKPGDYAYVLKITGLKDLAWDPVVRPQPDDTVLLKAADADLHGPNIAAETRGGETNIGFWDNPATSASWQFRAPKAGEYRVSLDASAMTANAEFIVEVAGSKLEGRAGNTGGWDRYQTFSPGSIRIPGAGVYTLNIRPAHPQTWKAMNLRSVILKP